MGKKFNHLEVGNLREHKHRILIINPGSTCTKIAVFENEISIWEKSIKHEIEATESYSNIIKQFDSRKNSILQTLDKDGINLSRLEAVCARGGLLRPIEGGTYEVNERMLADLKQGYSGEHASNLGGLLAFDIAAGLNIPAYIVDPVVVDELDDIARVSGLPMIERKSIFHALNHKAVAHRVAKELDSHYEDINLIVAHMGGGITIGAHRHGRVIDVNNGLLGEGPFCPERAGAVPVGDIVDLCFSGKFTKEEIMKLLVGKGGFIGYLGTNDLDAIEERIAMGDKKAGLIYSAMAYQIAKDIGAASVVLAGRVNGIILTGELASKKNFVREISDRVCWIADVYVQPGENELLSLAEGALRVLRGEEKAKEYLGKCLLKR